MNNHTLPPARLAWTMWGLGAALYLYAFFQRVAPGVMTVELSEDFALSASALGNLSAFYFYSYVAMQIPTGILADVWGPRRLLTAGALMAGLGALFFAFSHSLALAATGRFLIGGSVAVAFVCMLKLAHHWFVPRQFALATGLALLTGIIGAVFAGVPLHLLVDSYGWRNVMAVSAVFPIIIGLVIWFFVRDDPGEKGYQSYIKHEPAKDKNPWAHALSGLMDVMRYRNTWLLSIVPGGVVGSILAFAGLWGVPFLTTQHGLTTGDAAAVCSAMLISWAVGGPVIGALSDRIGLRKPLYVLGCGFIALGWSFIVLMPDMNTLLLIILLLMIGFASGCMIVGFAFAKESLPGRLAGTVSGVVNMGVMMGPMILQPAVGWMLDRNWSGEQGAGIKMYGIGAYQNGFMLMAGWAVVSFVLILFTTETRSLPDS
ncbi:MAG: MFS transporter [Gammaproteobacteria bacterium]|nr:MFS transporter [Gammaproteobacteria bacterium]